jgi:hypothetical protein
MKWITASDIKNWANTKQRRCAETLPELIRRLIFATTPEIEEIDFPSGDSIATGGWDGRLKIPADSKFPFVPSGGSGWEIGAEKTPGKKADKDYLNRTKNPQGLVPQETTFVFVTPRPFPERAKWQSGKQKTNEWKDVRVMAADMLETWLDSAPAVALWLARQVGNAVQGGARDLEDAWEEWSRAAKPKITPELVIAGRSKEAKRIQEWIASRSGILEVQGDSPDEALAFLYAAIHTLSERERVAAFSRCVVVDNLKEFRAIQAFAGPLIIAAPGECADAAAAAEARGHQVYLSMDATVTDIRGGSIKLPRPKRSVVEAELHKSGLSKLNAQKLSRDFGRSIPVLRRNRSVSNAVRSPVWASSKAAQVLLPALFAGSWVDNQKGDRKVLTTISGKPYREFIKKLRRFLTVEDSPIRKIGHVWTFKSPLDAWFLLARHLDDESIEHFRQVVHSVLSETDPKYELSPDKRWAAAIYGKTSEFSEWLRSGLVESLVLMAVYGDRSPVIDSTQAFVSSVVKEILAEANKWEIWSSLQDGTPMIAEAAPDAFLSSVENLIISNSSVLQNLLQDDGNSMFGECRHAGLLWALESLAWSSEYFTRAVTVLIDLAELDPGGKWNNRPINSLFDIFLPGHPQTYASPSERLLVLEKLASERPVLTWTFASRYFGSGSFSESHTFQWRDAGGERRGFEPESQQDYQKYLAELLPLLLKLACVKENLLATSQEFTQLPDEFRDEFIKCVGSIEPKAFSNSECNELRNHIRGQLNWINTHGDQKIRAYAPGLFDLLKRLEPTSILDRVGWLLGDAWPRLPQGESLDYQAHQAVVSSEREKAAREVLDTASLSEILDYAKTVKYVGVFGHALGKVVKDEKEDAVVLDAMIARVSENPGIITGYAIGRVEAAGSTWVEKEIQRLTGQENYSPDVSALLLLGLPEATQTWTVVNKYGQDVEEAYWRRATGRARDEKDVSLPVRKLLDVKRPFASLELAGSPEAAAPSQLLQELIRAILTSNKVEGTVGNPTMRDFYLGQVFKKLYEQNDLSLEELALLEWPFAALFDELRRYTSQPFAIHRALQQDPQFFAMLISYTYKRDDRVRDPAQKQLTDVRTERLAENASKVMDSWKLVPGLHADGSFNEKDLFDWIESARKECAGSGHVIGGDLQIGKLLASVPDDPDGMWPHTAVRNLLQHLKNEIIEKQLQVAIYNNRGVVQRGLDEGGVQERELAGKYKTMSSAMKVKWPRTAAMLRSVAEYYTSNAKHEDILAELNDLRFG